ncbi:MAG: DUF5711 family protein [Acetivibrionales bacterium]|jgi:hypothetical protein
MADEDIKSGKSGSKASVFMFFLLVFVITVVAFLAYLRTEDINLERFNLKEYIVSTFIQENNTPGNSELLKLDYDERAYTVFSVYKGQIIKCTSEYIKGINTRGEEVWSRNISFNKPLIKLNGSEMLVADIGGRSSMVFKGGNLKWEVSTDSAIVNADISKEGYVTLVQEAEGYKNKVKVYDPYGVEMFYINIAENFVLSAGVSPSGEEIVINSINTSGISVKSKIEFTRLLDDNPFAAVMKEDVVFPSIWFLDDDSLLAVGNTHIVCFDRDREEAWSRAVKKVFSSNVCMGKFIIVASEGKSESGYYAGNGVMVEILNKKGQQAAVYPIGDKVKNIKSYSGLIAVNTGREVHFIDTKGTLKYKAGSKVDILDVHFINKLEAVIVTKNSVEVKRIGG